MGKCCCPNRSAITDGTFSGLRNLIRLLPTGTAFTYLFLGPLFSNFGRCHPFNKLLTGVLVGVCGWSCFISTFTDSYVGLDGRTHFGIATRKGLWPSRRESHNVDLAVYRLRFRDFVHALFVMLVFAVVVFLDPNTVGCFSLTSNRSFLKLMPPLVGMVSSVVFFFFPTSRNGIGYFSTSSSKSREISLSTAQGV
ncbi:hypothetical protein CJ030_MR5G027249 [Morella rubra]|uniref:Uncharacterized protein n=1 Tax=Morella rubra TaxID=262757 RepID=A0A6A1VQ88_9ROSI|nr:hypothetical protein CJ030_MR5G027249 [Morella rubra]